MFLLPSTIEMKCRQQGRGSKWFQCKLEIPAKSEIFSLKKEPETKLEKRFDQKGLVPYHGWYCLNDSLKDSHNHNQNKPLPKDIREKQETQRNIISHMKC